MLSLLFFFPPTYSDVVLETLICLKRIPTYGWNCLIFMSRMVLWQNPNFFILDFFEWTHVVSMAKLFFYEAGKWNCREFISRIDTYTTYDAKKHLVGSIMGLFIQHILRKNVGRWKGQQSLGFKSIFKKYLNFFRIFYFKLIFFLIFSYHFNIYLY
jgi:hypothetical protein